MNIRRMRMIITEHGHLIQEGDETKAELIEALQNLRKHTYEYCHRPWLGKAPIDALLPRVEDLYTRRETRPVRNIDMRKDQL